MPNTPSASATVQSTRITLPAPGTHAQVDARSGITFDFNTNEATFERVGDDLQIKTDGGGTVTLTVFFVVENVDALPVFTLADGQQVASGDFLKSLDVDITTAAGPSASSAPGSGGTSYADDTGSLLGGVDRLDSLGSDQWSQSTAAPETPGTVTVAAVTAGTAPASSESLESPAIPEAPETPPLLGSETPEAPPSTLLPDADFPAVMRFVLFRDTPETDPAMTGMCAEAAGSTQGATVQTEYGTATIAADGAITYTFTGTPEPGTQYIDYIKFTDANGNVHSVQVVVTDNPNYADDSDVYNTAGIINREAHDGTLASGGYDATSGDKNALGDGNDVITYTRMDDGSLATGAGQNTISISGGIRNSAINAGNEANTVLVGGMLGTDAGTSSIYSQGGTITVQVDKNADNAAAMSAQNGGRSSITTEDATILVDARTSTGGAGGMDAFNGDNTIKATGTGSIEVTAQGATWATGISARGSGVNTLTSDTGNITVTANANTSSGSAYGVSASGGENLLTSAADIDITATARNAYGLSASGGGKNIIGTETAQAGDVTILANMKDGAPTGSGTAYGLYAADSGSTAIDASGSVVIKAGTTGSHAQGMGATDGSNIVTADSVTIDAQSKTTGTGPLGGSASGMVADSGSNIINAATRVDINAQSTERYAYGLHAQGGTNTINAAEAEVVINAASTSGNAYGVYAPGGKNIITADDLTITAASTKGTAYGLNAMAGGKNIIGTETEKAGDVTILANMKDGTPTGSGTAYGLYAADSGSGNTIDASGSVVIKAGTTGSHAQGMGATGGSNIVTADSVAIGTQSKTTGIGTSGGSASGMAADSGSNIINAATRVDINAQSTERYAYGLHAQGGTNTINAAEAEVVINAASASGNAYGAYAPGGKNIITADDLTITAASTKGTAYGLNAMSGGSNTIDASKVDITATGATGTSNAYGMYASGGVNTIRAAEGSQGIEVHITVAAGSGGKAYAMFASGKGTNTITGGTGDDFINIKGGIYTDGGGKNIIDLSKGGSNTVILDGVVSKGGLTLIQGAGHDTLILKAANLTEFDAKFKSWLTDLYKNGIEVEDVKLVASSDMSEADRAAYLLSVQNLFPAADRDKISLINQEDVPTSAPSSATPAAASTDLEGSTDPSPAAANAPQPMQASLSRMAFAAAAFSAGEETQMTDAATYHAAADASLMAAPAFGVYTATAEHTDAAAASQAPETAPVAQAAQLAHQGEGLAAQVATDPEDAVHGITEGPVLAGEDVLAMEGTASPAVEAGNPDDVLPGVHPEDALVSLGHENDWILLNNVDSNAPVTMQDGNDSLILQLDEGVDTAPAVPGLLPELWNDLAASQNDTMSEETLDQVFTAMTCTAPLGAEATETTCSAWQDEAAVQTSAVDIGQGVFGAYQQDMSGDTLSLFMQQTIV